MRGAARLHAGALARAVAPTLVLALVLPLALGGCAIFRPRPPSYEPVVHPSGLVVQDLVVPEGGPVADPGDQVTLHYVGRVDGGEVFDSSLDRGTPITFVLGEAEVPEGLQTGLEGMRRLGRRRILVPPHLGYGAEGVPGVVPPDATLEFEVELLDVVEAAPEAAPEPAEGPGAATVNPSANDREPGR